MAQQRKGDGGLLDRVRDAYEALWGPPSAMATFRAELDAAEVLKWAPHRNPEGVTLYATLGASASPMATMGTGHRIEFFTGLQPEKDEVADPLAALALYPNRESVAINDGDTVPSDGPLWAGTEMRHFLILKQVADAIIPTLELPEGIHVEFLNAVPIFDSERTLKSTRGIEGLVQAWSNLGIAYWDPDRRPPALGPETA